MRWLIGPPSAIDIGAGEYALARRRADVVSSGDAHHGDHRAIRGDGDTVVSHVATLDNAGAGAITFLANPRYRAKLATTRATAVIVMPDDAPATALPKLVAANPYATFAKVAAILHPSVRPAPSIDPTAQIDVTAKVAQSVSVGACAVIGIVALMQHDHGIGVGKEHSLEREWFVADVVPELGATGNG